MQISIIKLGGSIITDPHEEDYFDEKNTFRLAQELQRYSGRCIIVHGTGYVGKPPAVQYGYVETGLLKNDYASIAMSIKDSLQKLNGQVVRTFLSASVPVTPVDIGSYYDEFSGSSFKDEFRQTIVEILGNGMVPIFHGDLLPLRDGSFKVISSDFIVLILTRILHPENVVFLCDVPGIYSKKSESGSYGFSSILPLLTPENIKLMEILGNDRADVSGGMHKKAEIALEISKYCRRCFIGSGYQEHLLYDFFEMRHVPGTIVKG